MKRAPVAVEFRVRCGGSLHRIVLTRKGRLVLADHDPIADALAGTTDHRCGRILAEWRARMATGSAYRRRVTRPTSFQRDPAFPAQLVQAVAEAAERKRERVRRRAGKTPSVAPVYGMDASAIHLRAQAALHRAADAFFARNGIDVARRKGPAPFTVVYDAVRGRLRQQGSGRDWSSQRAVKTSLGPVVRAIRSGEKNLFAINRLGEEVRLDCGIPE
jgi:hypothetical protein